MIHARDSRFPAAEDSHCRWRRTQPQGFCEDRAGRPLSQGQSIRYFHRVWASPVAQWDRISLQCSSRNRRGFHSWGWRSPPEKGMATHSRILAWRIPMYRGAWWATVHRVPKSQTRPPHATGCGPKKETGGKRRKT